MTRFKLLGVAAILSLLSATPALAQHLIDEPDPSDVTSPVGDLGIGSSPPLADSAGTMQANPRMKSHVMTTRHARRPK